ncbi:MAG: MFS transporter [Oscillospiraceae bacterium]|jgi:OPA family glycerol-3-phosphate transporter-like MFS transporter|nr:MFS transporter [Oscillospiraceae bacterium]
MSHEQPKHSNRAVLLWCWLIYVAAYIGRYNLSAVIGAMSDAGVMPRGSAGVLTSIFFFSYMIFQSVSAVALRGVDPALAIGIVTIASAIVNAAMPLAARDSFIAACVLWGAHGIAQSAVWPCVVRILTERLPRERIPRAMVLLNTSGSAGTAITYLAIALGMRVYSWQAAFYIPAVLLIIAATAWIARVYRPRGSSEQSAFSSIQAEDPRPVETAASSIQTKDPLPVETAASSIQTEDPLPAETAAHTSLLHLLSAGVLMMLFLAAVNGFLRDGVTIWLPTYIQDTFRVPASTAILLSILIPIAKTVGPFAAYRLLKLFKSHALASAVGIAVTLASLCSAALLGAASLPLSLACLSVCAVMVVALNTEIVCLYPLVYQQYGMTAQASSIINSFVYVGSIAASAAFGFLSEAKGWQAVMILLCALTAMALMVSFAMRWWERARERRAAAAPAQASV